MLFQNKAIIQQIAKPPIIRGLISLKHQASLVKDTPTSAGTPTPINHWSAKYQSETSTFVDLLQIPSSRPSAIQIEESKDYDDSMDSTRSRSKSSSRKRRRHISSYAIMHQDKLRSLGVSYHAVKYKSKT